MSDQPPDATRRSLTVLPHSGKVEQLRREIASPPTKQTDSTLISRFVNPNKTPAQKAIEEKVISAIQTIYDPEIPVNIYDLGLIYEIRVGEAIKVSIRMTLTAPGCPVAGELVAQVKSRVEALPEVTSADVELVWDPPWDRSMMSEAAKLELGL